MVAPPLFKKVGGGGHGPPTFEQFILCLLIVVAKNTALVSQDASEHTSVHLKSQNFPEEHVSRPS